jgi:hypothetical protein
MLTYKKCKEPDFTLFKGSANVPLVEWKDTLAEYASNGPTKYELYDLREMTNTLENHEVRFIATMSDFQKDTRTKGSKTAVVVDHSLKEWAVRFYGILSEVAHVNWSTKPFLNMNDAISWLGIDVSGIDEVEAF